MNNHKNVFLADLIKLIFSVFCLQCFVIYVKYLVKNQARYDNACYFILSPIAYSYQSISCKILKIFQLKRIPCISCKVSTCMLLIYLNITLNPTHFSLTLSAMEFLIGNLYHFSEWGLIFDNLCQFILLVQMFSFIMLLNFSI